MLSCQSREDNSGFLLDGRTARTGQEKDSFFEAQPKSRRKHIRLDSISMVLSARFVEYC